MGQVGTFIHSSQHGLTLAITDAYGATRRHAIDLNQDSTFLGTQRAVAHLSAVYIHVNSIAAGCTGLTFRLSKDAAGDQPWISDTSATLSTGVTTATQGAVTAKIDVDFIKNSDDILYLHVKTTPAGGTCTVDRIELVWRE
jgi:hypothetical protein